MTIFSLFIYRPYLILYNLFYVLKEDIFHISIRRLETLLLRTPTLKTSYWMIDFKALLEDT